MNIYVNQTESGFFVVLTSDILMLPVWTRSTVSNCTVNHWLVTGRAPTSTPCMVWENCLKDLLGFQLFIVIIKQVIVFVSD